MTTIRLDTNKAAFKAAFMLAPDIMEKYASQAVRKALVRISRPARRKAPKAFSTLASSIIPEMVGKLEGTVGPLANYGEVVERGHRGQRPPPMQPILDWISVKRIEPEDPNMDEQDLAFIIGRKLSQEGMGKQPYLMPAAAEVEQDIYRDFDVAIDSALAEIARR